MEGTLKIDRNLNPVMRDCVISNVAPTGEENENYAHVYEKYIETRDLTLLTSLTTTQDPILLQR